RDGRRRRELVGAEVYHGSWHRVAVQNATVAVQIDRRQRRRAVFPGVDSRRAGLQPQIARGWLGEERRSRDVAVEACLIGARATVCGAAAGEDVVEAENRRRCREEAAALDSCLSGSGED